MIVKMRNLNDLLTMGLL